MAAPHNDFANMGWVKFLGFKTTEAAAGRCVIRLDPQPAHLNHNGDVNAAVLFGLAEIAGAGALVSGLGDFAAKAFVVARRGDIEYVGRARGAVTATGAIPADVFADIRERAARKEELEVPCPVTLTDDAGATISTASVVMLIRPRRERS
ncbi:PaaI family thioesterase [Yinghuangia soli]|uniref:PaaI family thioesterase n=1 Tax=Yinghuangia soli TaxID=2908204 RepID=A0AA41PU77_9ACTN|nr:PaaI family thioesterase [Yinghuangia soli]MCF2525953.1 PaaI family thioesterase [Yinghuangia soli]